MVGNISQSFLLEDEDSFFLKPVCVPLIKYYREKNVLGGDPISANALLGPKSKLVLDKFWSIINTKMNLIHTMTILVFILLLFG